jgi:hypothetical protein
MGFRLNRTYVLQFEGVLDGLEVKIKSTPIAVTLELQGEVNYERLCELFAEYVTEWNYEDEEGKVVPLTSEGIHANLEHVVLQKIVQQWIRAARGVTAPLDPPSIDGTQSLEELIPMETS